MQVDKISFQAHVPSRLRNKLFTTANMNGSKACQAYMSHLKNVESWGMDTSVVTDVLSTRNEKVLALANPYLAPGRNVKFNQKNSLFDTFMSLTEKDIISAENTLQI